jgi:hypothetical protein
LNGGNAEALFRLQPRAISPITRQTQTFFIPILQVKLEAAYSAIAAGVWQFAADERRLGGGKKQVGNF